MIEDFKWNKELFFWINDFAGKNDVWDWIFIFMAEYLIFIIIGLFFLYFAKQIWRDKKIEIKELIIFFSASVGAWVLTKIIKIFVGAERPFSYLNLENTLMTHDNIFASFPSGHSTLSFALATSVWIYNKKIGSILLFLAFLVAIGRPLVGVHFPLDIFAGAIIGIGVVLIVGKYFKERYKK